MEKEYKSVNKRFKILRDRRMEISTAKQRKIIKQYNYYNLINAYKAPFLEDPGNYPQNFNPNEDCYIVGTKPEYLEYLYKFDEKLRLMFLKYILKIEEKLKDALVQSFYEYHNGHSSASQRKSLHRESEYLRRNYYNLNDTDINTITYRSGYRENKIGPRIRRESQHKFPPKFKTVRNSNIYDESIAMIYKEIGQQRRKKKYIADYLDRHTYLPMWVLVNILTLGKVSKLFQIQETDVQYLIYKKLNLRGSVNNPTLNDLVNLANLIQILSLYRNMCAHNERFYCTKVNIVIGDDFLGYLSKFPMSNQVSTFHGNTGTLPGNTYGNLKRLRESLYTLMFAISVFLNNRELKKFKSEINKEIQLLKGSLPSRSFDTVLREMGLNFNWMDLL